MGNNYRHLGLEDRAVIQAKLDEGCSVRQISQRLGRAPSTISRELKRCGWAGPQVVRYMPSWKDGVNGYNCELAQRRACRLAGKPRVARKLVTGNSLWTAVLGFLRQGLSPQQASGTLARMPEPQRLSHETIYTALYAMAKGPQTAHFSETAFKSTRPASMGLLKPSS